MLRALLCELEGVLVHTAAMRRAAMAEAVDALGGRLPDDWRSQVTDPPVLPADAALAAAAAGLPDDETTADLLGIAASRAFLERVETSGVALADGAVGFVREASEHVRLGVVTRARRREADRLLAATPFADALAFVIAEEDAPRGKPHSDPYDRALERLRLPPGARSSVLALEHGAIGIAAAGAARLRCVAVGPFEQAAGVAPALAIPSIAAASFAGLARLAQTPDAGVTA